MPEAAVAKLESQIPGTREKDATLHPLDGYKCLSSAAFRRIVDLVTIELMHQLIPCVHEGSIAVTTLMNILNSLFFP